MTPTSPSVLGASTALPRCAKLYHDSDHAIAVALCTRRTRLPARTTRKVLDVLAELREANCVSEAVVALDSCAGSVAAAREAVRRETGSELFILSKDEEEGVSAGRSDVPVRESDGVGSSTTTTQADLVLEGDRGARREGGSSRLNEISMRRRSAARKRARRKFQLEAEHDPSGDQPKAIQFLTDGVLQHGRKYQTLHGVTGSGKTFMMANVIANVNRPTLILAPNKTLAAQLCNELTRYFPHNRVEFFVSHFKYYQPEAYLPSSDKYIAKASSVDPVIDRLRHAATRSLFERNDTIVVASVSSIYGLGLPTEYLERSIRLQVGDKMEGVTELVESLQALNYVLNESGGKLLRGCFEAKPNSIDLSPPWEAEGTIYRIALQGNCIVRLELVTGDSLERSDLGQELVIYPARHFVTPKDRLDVAISKIEEEARKCIEAFQNEGKLLEASRLEERVALDVEMMRKVGFCNGAENYTLYLSGRHELPSRGPPETLLDYLPQDGKWLLFVDESHVTVPQIGAMHAGNAARKRKLIRHGFRLPSAMENRPLSAREFWVKAHQTILVSATPGPFEIERSGRTGVVEAVIRPTGVLDPTVEVCRTKGQIEHLTLALARVAAQGGRAIVTTLTKQFAEDLAECLANKPAVHGVLDRALRVSFLHSGIDSVGRMQVLEAMRDDPMKYDAPAHLDVVVGVNLLREGIDLPAVRLVAILDADSEGFLRGETALIQTIGRAARNVDGHVVMYADLITSAMSRAIAETGRRRKIQIAYNTLYRITPTGAGSKAPLNSVRNSETLLDRIRKLRLQSGNILVEKSFGETSESSLERAMNTLEVLQKTDELSSADSIRSRMLTAAHVEDFETAALLRDCLVQIEARG